MKQEEVVEEQELVVAANRETFLISIFPIRLSLSCRGGWRPTYTYTRNRIELPTNEGERHRVVADNIMHSKTLYKYTSVCICQFMYKLIRILGSTFFSQFDLLLDLSDSLMMTTTREILAWPTDNWLAPVFRRFYFLITHVKLYSTKARE